MNVLDENISVIQRQLLRSWRISVRHIGYDAGRNGMTDEEIIPFLLTLRRPTFSHSTGTFTGLNCAMQDTVWSLWM